MKRWLLITVALVAIITAVLWGMADKSKSYPEPQEALLAIDNDFLLIPAYKFNDKALFFFIKDENSLGSVYVQKGFFGWKADMLTWSPIDNAGVYDNRLNGIHGQGERLLYGLIKHGDDRIVQVNEEHAIILNLAMLPQDEIDRFKLEDLYIWYFESEKPLTDGEIKLLDKDTDRLLDKVNF